MKSTVSARVHGSTPVVSGRPTGLSWDGRPSLDEMHGVSTARSLSPLVSIVLPTYNRAHMILPAIESCLSQTYRNIEVIVVDDGSTDNTAEVVARAQHGDKRLRYLRQENSRIPAALNTGFRAARGELLTWTSDDNAYEENAIEIMAAYLDAHPGVGLVYCDCQIVDRSGKLVRMSWRKPPSDIERKNVVGACFMYRRSIAEVVGEYDCGTFLAEDYDYWLRISKVAPLAHLSGIAPYRFRVHEASLSSLRGAEAELQAARARTKYARTPQESRALMAAGHCAAAAELRRTGSHWQALKHSLRAVQLGPARPFTYGNLLLTCGRLVLRPELVRKVMQQSREQSSGRRQQPACELAHMIERSRRRFALDGREFRARREPLKLAIGPAGPADDDAYLG